jgi:hypothetical protein
MLWKLWTWGGIGPPILDLGPRWIWVVNFMTQLLYLWAKHPLYPLNRRLVVGTQSQFGCFWEDKNLGCGTMIHWTSGCSLVIVTDCAIPAPPCRVMLWKMSSAYISLFLWCRIAVMQQNMQIMCGSIMLKKGLQSTLQ